MAAFRAGIEVESVQQLKKELFLSEKVQIIGPINHRDSLWVKFKAFSQISAILAIFWLKWLFLGVISKSRVFNILNLNRNVYLPVKMRGSSSPYEL